MPDLVPEQESMKSASGVSFVYRVKHLLGIDRAIAFTVLGRTWSMSAGVVTLLLIARFVSPVEQGYYYTFLSLVALQIFFELGFCLVILQMASHERAKLIITEAGDVQGDAVAHARLASVFQTALRWYSKVSVLMACCVIPAGFWFFQTSQHHVASVSGWRAPWSLLVIAASLNLMIDPIFSFLEGCGLISQVARMRLGQGILGSTLAWCAIISHHPLFGPPGTLCGMVLWGSIWLFRRRRLLIHLAKFDVGLYGVSWGREIWPFQWRIAVSWLGGYLIFQILNPVLFRFQGPIIAGKMGMSLTIANALGTVALAWMNTKASPFGTLIAQRRFEELDHIFFRTMKQSIAILVCASTLVFGGLLTCTYLAPKMTSRVLPLWALALLLLTSIMNHLVFCEAVYLRAHKAEPFLISSLVFSILMGAGTYFLARFSTLTAVVLWYFLALGICSPIVASVIFLRKRQDWHPKPLPDRLEHEVPC